VADAGVLSAGETPVARLRARGISISISFVERARNVGGERTTKAAVARALEEITARRQHKRVVELMGKRVGRHARLPATKHCPLQLRQPTAK
jgi:hypothetical protein